MNLQLGFIIDAVGGQLLSGSAATVDRVETDSRTVHPGSLFVALRGERYDGHDFVMKAIESGAAAVLVSRKVEISSATGTAVILVDDTLIALQQLAAQYRRTFSLPVIAVTGSVGKTTTKDILADCLGSRYNTLKTQANFNNEIGLPMSLLNLRPFHQAAVFEIGMRVPGDIRHLAQLMEPNYAIITNVEPVHLETMGSLENIAQAKCEVFEFIKNDGFVLLNGDNRLLLEEAEHYPCQKYFFGFMDHCDIKIKSLENDGAGIRVRMQMFDRGEEEFYLPVPVSQMAYNLAAAVGMAYLMGVDSEEIKSALKSFQPSGNRMNVINLAGSGVLIDDSYNANPISVVAALEACRKISRGRRTVAVLGDMLELGAYEQEGHLKAGQRAAEVGIDLLVTIGSLAQYYREGALMAGMKKDNTHHFDSREEALAWLRDHVSDADVILVKASRGMQLDILARDLFAEN